MKIRIYTYLILLAVTILLSSCSVSPRELASDYTDTSVVGYVSELVYCTDFEHSVLSEGEESCIIPTLTSQTSQARGVLMINNTIAYVE